MAIDPELFAAMRKLLQPFAKKLCCTKDSPADYFLYGTRPDAKGRPVFFGAVQVKKSYVSFHLMPVYLNPELLQDVSSGLQKRMQGKSCFNFTKVDGALLKELGVLVKAGFQYFQEKGYA